MLSLDPSSRFSSDDLPTLGSPTRATVPARVVGTSGMGRNVGGRGVRSQKPEARRSEELGAGILPFGLPCGGRVSASGRRCENVTSSFWLLASGFWLLAP